MEFDALAHKHAIVYVCMCMCVLTLNTVESENAKESGSRKKKLYCPSQFWCLLWRAARIPFSQRYVLCVVFLVWKKRAKDSGEKLRNFQEMELKPNTTSRANTYTHTHIDTHTHANTRQNLIDSGNCVWRAPAEIRNGNAVYIHAEAKKIVLGRDREQTKKRRERSKETMLMTFNSIND